MNVNNVKISALPYSVEEFEKSYYDIGIYAVGYETRSSFLARKSMDRNLVNIGIYFENCQEISFPENINYFQESAAILISENSLYNGDFPNIIRESIKSDDIKILLDVSSFTRTSISKIILELSSLVSICHSVDLVIGYSSAEFCESDNHNTITHAGPVLPELAGWPLSIDTSTECIIGMGYEEGKALGIVEYIEPNRTWLFKPLSDDNIFNKKILRANKNLLEISPSENIIEYELNKPYSSFKRLESLTLSFLDRSRVIVVPLGPKIFFALSVIISLKYYPLISLWRVSSDHSDNILDKIPTGELFFLKAIIQKKFRNDSILQEYNI